jgi:plastocyanin
VLDNRFDPQRVSIEPGTTVRWVNRGTTGDHTTTEMSMEWDSGFVFLGPGDTFEHTFTQDDDGMTFEYSCVTHKTCCAMQGSVRVGANAPPPAPGY